MAGFSSVILLVLTQTLNNSDPNFKLDLSLRGGTNVTVNLNGANLLPNCSQTGTAEPEPIPRLEYVPMPEDHSADNNLIQFQHGADSKSSWKPWSDRLQKFLHPFDEGKDYSYNIVYCDHSKPPASGKVCYLDLNSLGQNCSKERNFGYDMGQPCVLIKMNEILGWTPITYSGSDLPIEMPKDLKEDIRRSRPENSNVWLSCEGESSADRDNMGPIVYTPNRGLPSYFFPFNNTENYRPPFVFVQFLKPTPGVLVNIECKAWAQNIAYDRMEGRGSVHFQLRVD